MSTPPLTALSHGAGCGCKLPPSALHGLLARLDPAAGDAVLVGNETADDAAVVQVADDLAVISTADFFTPIVDDPYDFGRIAATNALSDVYAMGGRPVCAINLVAWPLETLGAEPLEQVLRGGADVAAKAGIGIVGGHSIDDPEPKYGLAVTGVVAPDAVLRNSTARTGDDLFLSKPVGTGVASTALKRGLADAELIETAVAAMTTLNDEAAEAARAAAASAVTDVTGFGLLGHLHELASASGCAAIVEANSVPTLPGVVELLGGPEPPIAGGSRRNRYWVEPYVDWAKLVGEPWRWVLCDAMTSGGLLVAAPPGSYDVGAKIGAVVAGEAGRISVL